MEVKTIEELLAQPEGTIVKRLDLRFQVPDAKTQKALSKWEAKTDNHKFEGGDVYIIKDTLSELNSFKHYIKKKFKLTCRTIKHEGRTICTLERLTPNKPKKKKKKAVEAQAIVMEVSGGQ